MDPPILVAQWKHSTFFGRPLDARSVYGSHGRLRPENDSCRTPALDPLPDKENQSLGIPVALELERWEEEDRLLVENSTRTSTITEDPREVNTTHKGVPERGLLRVDYPSVEDQGSAPMKKSASS